MALRKIKTTSIADDAIDSDQYVNGSIDNAHLADDAVGIDELSATGTASSSTFLRGDNAWQAAGGGLNSLQTFTSSGTWTRPSGVTKVIIEVQGAGGSGSDTAEDNNNGGGGGGYAKKFLDVSSISSSTITVGSGGASNASGAGNAGGASTWSDGTNTITGGGGSGGVTSVGTGTAGGSASGGDVNIDGGRGQPLSYYHSGGGHSILGIAGEGGFGASWHASQAPTGYGAGSGSHYLGTALAARDGIIIVWEYK